MKCKQLNALLQILMKCLAMLNRQNFETSTKHVDVASERTSTLDEICTFLRETAKFQLDVDHEVTDDRLMSGLRDCVRYCLRKNEKLFVRIKPREDCGSDEYRFKLDSVYIRQKMAASRMASVTNSIDPDAEKEVASGTIKAEKLEETNLETSKLLIVYNCPVNSI